eukprot:CAMPEP_0171798214 /NCGR_PEP_ID=MMETSP0991-20121206/70436_1 /TAXON_ID=483369 /ORGANISM="non described non described, Strain CCMP2098" /LENGTH=483 /DNA_ID=CAMNT_0012409461 /DNA_START=42 /DNA_END=1489 /DNA_ORIENTATION=-
MASGPADETTKAHVESALKALQAVQRPESTGGDVKAQARSLLQDMTTTLNEHETKKFEEKTGSRAMAEFSVAFMRGIEAVNLGKHAFDNDKISNKKKEWQCNACHVLPAPGKQLRTCSGCHARHYCSTECARRAWGGHAGHKVECTATKAMRRCVEEGMGGLSEEAISRVRSEVFQKCEKELTKQVAVENEAKAESERRQAATQQGPAALSLFDLRRSAAWENAFNAFVVPKDFASFDPAKPQSEAFLAQKFDSAAARAEGMPSRAKAEKSFEKLAAKANPKKKGKGKKNKAAKGASGGGGGDVDDADADADVKGSRSRMAGGGGMADAFMRILNQKLPGQQELQEVTDKDLSSSSVDTEAAVVDPNDAATTASAAAATKQAQGAVILAKRTTKLMKQAAEDKAEKKRAKVASKQKRDLKEVGLHVPDHHDIEYERALRRVATRGVVALFNAIAMHQHPPAADGEGGGGGGAAAALSSSSASS